jgi:hypothetical protein
MENFIEIESESTADLHGDEMHGEDKLADIQISVAVHI